MDKSFTIVACWELFMDCPKMPSYCLSPRYYLSILNCIGIMQANFFFFSFLFFFLLSQKEGTREPSKLFSYRDVITVVSNLLSHSCYPKLGWVWPPFSKRKIVFFIKNAKILCLVPWILEKRVLKNVKI